MPKGLQWSLDDVYNAERAAKIQADANAKALRAEYDRQRREEAREKELERRQAPQPKPYVRGAGFAGINVLQGKIAECKARMAQLEEMRLASELQRAGLTLEAYQRYDYRTNLLLSATVGSWDYIWARYPKCGRVLHRTMREQGMTEPEARGYLCKTYTDADWEEYREPELEAIWHFKRDKRAKQAEEQAEWERRRAERLAREAQNENTKR